MREQKQTLCRANGSIGLILLEPTRLTIVGSQISGAGYLWRLNNSNPIIAKLISQLITATHPQHPGEELLIGGDTTTTWVFEIRGKDLLYLSFQHQRPWLDSADHQYDYTIDCRGMKY